MYIGITSATSRPTPACIYYYYSTHRPLSSMDLEYKPHLVILDGNNTIRALLPLLSLGKDTARLNPQLSPSPIARKINLVSQTKLIIQRDLQRYKSYINYFREESNIVHR